MMLLHHRTCGAETVLAVNGNNEITSEVTDAFYYTAYVWLGALHTHLTNRGFKKKKTGSDHRTLHFTFKLYAYWLDEACCAFLGELVRQSVHIGLVWAGPGRNVKAGSSLPVTGNIQRGFSLGIWSSHTQSCSCLRRKSAAQSQDGTGPSAKESPQVHWRHTPMSLLCLRRCTPVASAVGTWTTTSSINNLQKQKLQST